MPPDRPNPEPSPEPAPEPNPEAFALIAVNRPVFGNFHYRVPAAMRAELAVGSRVSVPFGGGRAVGVCVGLDHGPPPVAVEKVKAISALVDTEPLFTAETLGLAAWMARYYLCPLGEVLASFLPSGVARAQRAARSVSLAPEHAAAIAAGSEALARRAPKQTAILALLAESGELPWSTFRGDRAFSTAAYQALVKKGWVRVLHGPAPGPLPEPVDHSSQPPPPEPTRAQVEAVAAIGEAEGFAPFLLWGVTGSGKTEVYLRAIRERVARGRQAIVLVPEIALTPQTVDRFRARFDRVAVLHSGLSDSERSRAWLAVRRGESDVVIGPRSAIFAPAPNLGIIVVDEEHESTFKQQNTPRYHARDLAVKRAQVLGIPVVLGSATPAVESWHNAQCGRYRLLVLPDRVTGRPLPRVDVVDLTTDSVSRRAISILGRTLETAIGETLGREEQVMLFLNRRGFHTVCICDLCGTPVRCPHCDLTLTFHKRRRVLTCHACLHAIEPPERCPECGGDADALKFMGLGTERIEEVIRECFPTARVARMDSDTMTRPEAYREVLAEFRARRLDMLVGTQMIAKGLDLPGVTLVGVISADTALSIADFRSSERTFQLLTQVAGRAGRGEAAGRVIVQSLDTAHFAIQTACRQDYRAFVTRELAAREMFGLPPFRRMLRLVFSSRDEDRLRKAARTAAGMLAVAAEQAPVEVLGPVPAPVYKLRNEFRHHALVKAERNDDLREVFKLLQSGPRGWLSGVNMVVDVDPVGLA